MERTRRVQQFWSWLPAFRAVAETEHLPSAADALHISPSALSRTVRLLEDSLGTPLFDRSGRALRLNEDGRILLGAVRDAMRGVHDAMETVAGEVARGPVHLQIDAGWLPLVHTDVVGALREQSPQLDLRVHPASDDVSALLQGRADVVLRGGALPHHDALTQRCLGSLPQQVYGASPNAPFAAPLGHEPERPEVDDGWPGHLAREIAFAAPTVGLRVAGCRLGYRAVLPILVAEHAGLSLAPVDASDAAAANGGDPSGPEPMSVFIATRTALGLSGRTDLLVDAVCAATASWFEPSP